MPSLIAGDWAASDRLRLGLASPDQSGIKSLPRVYLPRQNNNVGLLV
jgi:hypothetical protein